MANLFSANWNSLKYDIEIIKNNFVAAVHSDKKEDALQSYAEMQKLYETKTCLSIASFFQKKKVQASQKKVMGKMEKMLNKKNWFPGN